MIDDECGRHPVPGNERVVPRFYIIIIPHSSSVARVFLEPTAKLLDSPMGRVASRYPGDNDTDKTSPLLE